MARRLVEAGCARRHASAYGFWDTHGGNFKHLKTHLPTFDQGVSALVEDLYARGLDKDCTVVVWGEFGRTPKINKDAGRDHWARVNFALMSGGGMKTGQVIGSTDAIAGEAKNDPVPVPARAGHRVQEPGPRPARHGVRREQPPEPHPAEQRRCGGQGVLTTTPFAANVRREHRERPEQLALAVLAAKTTPITAMTEPEWLAATASERMLHSPGWHRTRRGYPSISNDLGTCHPSVNDSRKLRLYACACFRWSFPQLVYPVDRHALEAAELFADEAITADELATAFRKCGITAWNLARESALDSARMAIGGRPVRPDHPAGPQQFLPNPVRCDLLRCIFGNPFNPIAFDPSWLTETAVALATGIYADRAFDRLPILADALEEAGATTPTCSPTAGSPDRTPAAAGWWTACWAKSSRHTPCAVLKTAHGVCLLQCIPSVPRRSACSAPASPSWLSPRCW